MYDSMGNIFLEPLESKKVNQAMKDFLNYYNNYFSSFFRSPIEKAGALHAIFEFIHPYFDGNGRMGRAILIRDLQRGGFLHLAQYLPSIFYSTRSNYYLSLKRSQLTKNLGYFIAYLTECLNNANFIFLYLKASFELFRISLIKSNQLFSILLLLPHLLEENKAFGIKDIKKNFSTLTKQGITKMLLEFCEKNVLQKQINKDKKILLFKLNSDLYNSCRKNAKIKKGNKR